MDEFDEFPAEEPQQKSGGFLKFCLICGCLLALVAGLVFGMGAYAVSKAMFFDQAKTEAALADIVTCEIPQGYVGLFGMDMFGVKMACLAPAGTMQGQQNLPLMIMACSFPPGQGVQARQQMNQSLRTNAQMSVEEIEDVVLVVRGQEIETEKVTGTDANGQRMTQYILMIDRTEGGTEQALLMFMGLADQFDEDAMNAFLASIK